MTRLADIKGEAKCAVRETGCEKKRAVSSAEESGSLGGRGVGTPSGVPYRGRDTRCEVDSFVEEK